MSSGLLAKIEENMMKWNQKKFLSLDKYDMKNDQNTASLFTVGNGYMGIRGSFEEYSTLTVQGGYIRGFIDEIVDICTPVPTNDYLKKYYFNEEGLKVFEKMDCGINFADLLSVRIFIGEKQFTMWDGGLRSFSMELDTSRGVLVRKVEFDDGEGNVTAITFERFASFYNDHIFCQRVTVQPKNHSRSIRIVSGVDLRVKTNGQIITDLLLHESEGNKYYTRSVCKNKYHFEFATGVESNFYRNGQCITAPKVYQGTDLHALEQTMECKKGDSVMLEKVCCVYTSRDGKSDCLTSVKNILSKEECQYLVQYQKHQDVYSKEFDAVTVSIEGDSESDAVVKYCAYQTLISGCRSDGVHGVGAKGLTGEKYHQFVWWDSEIYQMPFFLYTNPETAKNTLLYRYSVLKQAQRNAKEKGLDGARFAFCSSVTGEECVWKFARHPFMQDHISADVAYAVLNYYHSTLDFEFMKQAGFELLFECVKYWLSRVQETPRGLEILQVTGTDEHHPYVDNDAYTNYLVWHIAKSAVKEYQEEKEKFDFNLINVDDGFISRVQNLARKIYLPMEENGLIPQFDGYFNLERGIECAGSENKGIQMKYNGLYHKSQIIKQPDVMLLYTYLNLDFNKDSYSYNWDYYEQMCESSSSLSYAPHAIAAADNKRPLSFVNYFLKTSRIDIDNLHGGTNEGLHSGCIAGSWLSIFRGIFGITANKNYLSIQPNFMPLWKKVSLKFIYQGTRFIITAQGKNILLKKEDKTDKSPVCLMVQGKLVQMTNQYKIQL